MKIFELDVLGITLAPSYYGLMYVVAFLYGLWYMKQQKILSKDQLDSFFIYIFVGVIAGGKLGYIFFYQFSRIFSDPISLLHNFGSGMSFHGGFIGVILASYIFSKKEKISYFLITDLLAKIAPVGIFFGRIGNYLNKELLGFPYFGPLAVQTPSGSYFPSPLLEAFLEGGVIFVLLHFFHRTSFPGRLSALFLIYYGVFRTIVELFFRTPDAHIGYYFGFLTQGSFLSIPMILVGIFLYVYLAKQGKH